MPLSPSRSSERILVMGGSGSGKTSSYFSIAKLYQQTSTPGTFHIIDTDYSFDAMTSGERYRDLTNLQPYPVIEWQEIEAASAKIAETAQKGDWVCLDMADAAWSGVQDHFSQEIFGMDLADFLYEARKIAHDTEKKGLKTFEQLLDWRPINARYRRWATDLFFRLPRQGINVITCTKATSLQDNEDPTIRKTFGPLGVKPAGQKDLAFQHDTVVFLQEAAKVGNYQITSVKDRERSRLEGEKLTSFARDYLLKTAGWTIA